MKKTSKYNQREVLIHIICNYYKLSKDTLIETSNNCYSAIGDATKMFSFLCNHLMIGTPQSIADHIERNPETVKRYIRETRFERNHDPQFVRDKQIILLLFNQGEKSIMPEYYLNLVPKEKMPDFIEYLDKFDYNPK